MDETTTDRPTLTTVEREAILVEDDRSVGAINETAAWPVPQRNGPRCCPQRTKRYARHRPRRDHDQKSFLEAGKDTVGVI